MKRIIGLLLTAGYLQLHAQQMPTMHYKIDPLSKTDTFYVSLEVDGTTLEQTSGVYQFVATAPGTYQTMNIGRFVSDFKAFDKKGKSLKVNRLSVNQFQIDKPSKITRISYAIAETFDTRVKDFPIYLMCGSSIEKDHVLINAHTVLGYFEGYQKSPIAIHVKQNEDWQAGTALARAGEAFVADDFDMAVDSPILLGHLSHADTMIATTQVDIYTYSKSGEISSELLLQGMSDMLDASLKFLVKLPVDKYTFLYFFEPDLKGTTGAWEHSYSSEYVLNEASPTPGFVQDVTDIASHEFFHIVTPLNIHSEIVEHFNFVKPTPSVHLWMYEGVTEWASNILLMRAGVVSDSMYFANSVAMKIMVDERYFDRSWSLKKISEESFNGGEGAKQYGNIYYRGSLVAGLLDIRLLELSEGKYGLRELILDLIAKYGKGHPVSEETFFDDLVAMTYPEIRELIDQYILNASPLPLEAYFARIGVKIERTQDGMVKAYKMTNMTPEQQKLYDAWSKNLPRN